MSSNTEDDARCIAWEKLRTNAVENPHIGIFMQVLDVSRTLSRISSFCATRIETFEAHGNHNNPEEASVAPITGERAETLVMLFQRVHQLARTSPDVNGDSWQRTLRKLLHVAGGAIPVECDWDAPYIGKQPMKHNANCEYTMGAKHIRSSRLLGAIPVPLSDETVNAVGPLMNVPVSDSLYGAIVKEILSLCSDERPIKFYGAMFTSALPSRFGDCEQCGLQLADAYDRSTATAMLRQFHAFGIDLPVFGMFFRDLCAYGRMVWGSEENGRMRLECAVVMDGRTGKVKEWDLRVAEDLMELIAVLDNLQEYTARILTPRVNEMLGKLKQNIDEGKIKPREWNATIPFVEERDQACEMGPSEVQWAADEGAEDEIERMMKMRELRRLLRNSLGELNRKYITRRRRM